MAISTFEVIFIALFLSVLLIEANPVPDSMLAAA